MSLSTAAIERPVATTLLTLALALAGGVAFQLLPAAPLPQVEFPTIQVSAALPGASPETMASSVAAPSTPIRSHRGRNRDDVDQLFGDHLAGPAIRFGP